MGVLGQTSGIYELGGPDTESFKALMQRMLGVIGRRALILAVPFFAARIMAFGLDMVQILTLGLIQNTQITRDQVRQLSRDNVVDAGDT